MMKDLTMKVLNPNPREGITRALKPISDGTNVPLIVRFAGNHPLHTDTDIEIFGHVPQAGGNGLISESV